MEYTNFYGEKVCCVECKTKNIHEYRSYTPKQFDGMYTHFIGWCIEHKAQGLQKYREAIKENLTSAK
jgi:hypothetical protein